MHRNTSAALAALLCLFLGPRLLAAHPTRPVRSAARSASSEPRLTASRPRSGRRSIAATTRRGSRPATASQKASSRHSVSTSHAIPAAHTARTTRTAAKAHTSTRGRRSRSIPQDDSSFLARSARAAAERRRQREDADAASHPDTTTLRTQLAGMDNDGSLLPASHSFSLYNDHGRLIVPAPLRGSREVLLHQNEMADRDGLTRVQDDEDLAELRAAKQLVPLPTSDALAVDERLPEDRRYSRPWTAVFLSAMSRDFYAHFHTPLQVDSAVRTVDVQKRLMRTNGNAAPAEGEIASPHLTGQAVDIAKHGLTLAEIAWLRLYLQPLMDSGKIDVEEEFRQACFHISVYKNYLPSMLPRMSVAATTSQPDAQP